MEAKFQIFLILLAVLAGTALLARRINAVPAILLLLAGIALAFVPGMPSIELPPELVLLVVLPPLIYSAGVAMSWREFKFNLRVIILLSVGCVIFTAFAVAAATHYLIGLPWGVGFLLGAIVAPPDVVAPLAIARKLGLPRRILVVLEGEGLANDATALTLYRFAVVAISTGLFSLPQATGTFAAIVVGEILFGAAVGWLSLRVRHRARDPQVEITLSLITPYVAYWIPEHFGGSGVIATVACGLYISWNGPLWISSATRLQGIFVWDLVIYLIEGLLFLLTGFQMRSLLEKSKAFPLHDILFAVGLVVVIVVVARFAWVYPATYLPRTFNKRLRERDPYPSWRTVFVIAFTGVRGAVSLAAALALPYTLSNGEAFPYRDLILFVTFGVILITLVGTGLGLPPLVRWLGVAQAGHDEHIAEHEAEIEARREALAAALKSLDAITDDRELSDEVVKLLRARHEIRANQLPDTLDPDKHDVSAAGTALTRELIAAERKFIHVLLRDGKITDETRRRIERDLDLEEASLSNREYRRIPL
ncbi:MULTISPECIES: Na+/H+ antiporter [Bradyrhizobium]|uniref:Sodium/proton antiporter, CPA1 family n=2 Tax=Bradyrhizobium TaxID=374 RepID=A0ABY0PSC5_9BRAD|nr:MULTISPECIES: Na+/H+ antiporter [Bradyrhizobium]SDI88156.1 sodium/proton antiporter, CPA1 family [Bradyrhizobium ottawaense]SED12027.1 sodium/proton antiporter, CPA1 family [Bradyrhizobium lablabi]SHL17995.1 sodium/proton antiporter, CPA1 family [Bradyrhizobium lablabi]